MALTDKLDAIADAIRAKTGKTALMTLDEMPAEIEGISGGGGIVTDDEYDYTTLHSVRVTHTSSSSTSGSTPVDFSDYLDGTEKIAFITAWINVSGYSSSSFSRIGIPGEYIQDKNALKLNPFNWSGANYTPNIDYEDNEVFYFYWDTLTLKGNVYYNKSLQGALFRNATICYYKRKEATA
jgi:hypothetical protein